MNSQKQPYLFSAIVGQNKIKTAYLANIVNPNIGGLLISGPKGTGKSTIVHSVSSILPEYEIVEGCGFNCDPKSTETFCTLCKERETINTIKKKMKIVNLPLSCTEDRLLGCVDIELLLKSGKKKILVGILGEANRNILYVDEVNLLPDHLVDDILDAAASSWNTIEREGFSITHPDNFILVGTMNPEEGELRPQILDRFPLCVHAMSIHEPKQRVEIVKRTILFENNSDEFYKIFEKENLALKSMIHQAQTLLPKVEIDESYIIAVAKANGQLKVDGQRPDIVIVKTARTIAAINQRTMVEENDILLSAEFTLTHRTRDGGLLEPATLEEIAAVYKPLLKKIKTKNKKPTGKTTFLNSINDINKDIDNFIEHIEDNTNDNSQDDGLKKK